jgi:hypothetical protein
MARQTQLGTSRHFSIPILIHTTQRIQNHQLLNLPTLSTFSFLKQPWQHRRFPQFMPIQLLNLQPHCKQQTTSNLSITNLLRNILRLNTRIIRDIQILWQKPTMVYKLEALVPERTDLGADDEIREAGIIEGRRIVAC